MKLLSGLAVISVLVLGLALMVRSRRDTVLLGDLSGAPQAEVADIVGRPDGASWTVDHSRAIVFATSATCTACSTTRPFEESLSRSAKALAIPVFFLLSSDAEEDTLAQKLKTQGESVIRGDLVRLGVARTPTVLAVDATGRVLAIRVGAVSDASTEKDRIMEEMLTGTSEPLYGRLQSSELTRYLQRGRPSEVIELRTPVRPISGEVHYRQIRLGDLSIRAPREIDKSTTVFVDCDSAGSPFACQEAMLILAKTWEPRRLFAINLPVRHAARQKTGR